MFIYEKKLEFPVKIKQTNPKLASLILTQFGGLYGNSVYIIYSSLYLFSKNITSMKNILYTVFIYVTSLNSKFAIKKAAFSH